MRNLTHQIKLCFLACFVLLATLPQATIAQTQLRDKIDVVGYYFVEPTQVVQDSQSAAITLTIPVPRGQTFEYKKGLQVVFITEEPNGNNDNIRIQINSLGVVKLLTRNGVEFTIGQLDEGIILTATFDGTNFRTDYRPPPEFRFVMPMDVTLTGNAYSVTDTSLPPVATAPILLGIKAQATNTGHVTLSVNSSQDYPVFFSNGQQITAGALENGRTIFCTFTTVGGLGFRAINLHASRSLKGRLVATLAIPAKDYLLFEHIIGWTVASGVTELGTANLPGMRFIGNNVERIDALLTLPKLRLTDSQLGWYFEILNGTTVVNSFLKNFGEISTFGRDVATDIVGISLLQLDYSDVFFSGIDKPTTGFATSTPVTIPAGYSIRMYVTEN